MSSKKIKIRIGFMFIIFITIILLLAIVNWGIVIESDRILGIISIIEHGIRAQFCLFILTGDISLLGVLIIWWINLELKMKDDEPITSSQLTTKETITLDAMKQERPTILSSY